MSMCHRSRRLIAHTAHIAPLAHLACIAGIVCMALLVWCTPTLAQQQREKIVALVRVSDYTASQPSNYLVRFDGAGNQVGSKTALGASVVDMLVSDDGQWIALTKFDQKTQEQSLEYRSAAANKSSVVRADKNGNGFTVNFSRDSRYLLYATVMGELPNILWLVGIIELASGTRAEYIGNVAFEGNPTAQFTGMPWPLDFNGSRLLFITVVPMSDAFPAGLYSVDLPQFKAGTRLALPGPATSWHQLPYPLGDPQLSPDGTRLLYLFNNPANPPANYEPMGMAITFNGLAVIDLNTGTDTIVAQAGKGQALEVAAWWHTTSDVAIFTGGNYQHSDRLISPRFYSVNVSTGQVTNTPPIFFSDNPQESVIGMLACSSGMFYVTQIGQDTRTETLYVAPLKDPHAGKKLLSGANMHFALRKCLPAQ